MSVTTILRDDVRNTGRSFVVLGTIAALAALVGLVIGADAGTHDHAYRALFDVSFLFFLALPLLLAPLTYLAIAGDRSRGSIKHSLGLPNTRAEYVLGKFLSRAAVAVGAVVVAITVGFAVAVVSYPNAPDAVRFAEFLGVSALYALSVTGVFVAISSTTRRRSRAMVGVVAAYFVLGPFWMGVFPVASLQTLIDALTSTLGVTLSETTRGLILNLSPATAYLNGTEIIYTGVLGDHPGIARSFESSEYYDELWFSAFVMALWTGVTLMVGYVRFRTAELG